MENCFLITSTLIDKSGVLNDTDQQIPKCKRDLAFIVDDSVKFNEIEAAGRRPLKIF
ncbi:MAG: hypothetical protein IPL23_10800 [Saprospiraceae bacterium]|nr:hypothetical protein [Saprospiraceae bacterium]